MPAIFTSTDVVDRSNEKDWAYKLALMDWDDTKILFTKRSLLEFLKHSGLTVDTNLTNIQKLPRWAEFGKISKDSEVPGPDVGSSEATAPGAPSSPTSSSGFKPTRRVREAPGGASSLGTIWGGTADDDDALSVAPPRPKPVEPSTTGEVQAAAPEQPSNNAGGSMGALERESGGFKPTRRVRDQPGGEDSIKNLWG